jgi:hypothetical protein
MPEISSTKEHQRLNEKHDEVVPPWSKWGPYLSERSWGTVREDYSEEGDAWRYFPHDHARSRMYRWGEDGLAGICDRYQTLCFAPSFWNGKDPILKERLFGLIPSESNHGEDVKEYYYYLDATPTHSYLKALYKYPQNEFPYTKLVDESRRRGPNEAEYELLDTGAFDEDRYWDIYIEYAKADPDDLCIKIRAFNRGPEPATLHLIPQLWYRNRWTWRHEPALPPSISAGSNRRTHICLVADDAEALPVRRLTFDYKLGKRYLYAEAGGQALFTNNETNSERVFGPHATNSTPNVKDAFHRKIINGEDCVAWNETGTKAAIQYVKGPIKPGESVTLRLRLTNRILSRPFADVEQVIADRKAEADAFYAAIHPRKASEDERRIQRQAFAGLIWSKQLYLFDVEEWLRGDDPNSPSPEHRQAVRNRHWRHLNSMRIFSMPDKWEYPWFAAWDLAFHTVPFALIDPGFAKRQLWLLLNEQFQHPNGQIPAYEWEFSDMNPPVHAWAVWRVYNMDRTQSGKPDRYFLEKAFHKLLMNFAWWVNKVDSDGNNVFEGGFLGLDNITVLDRSEELPEGMKLYQADATGWMGMFCLNMMRIALELAKENSAYESLATKFFEHYVYIAAAMKHLGKKGFQLWDEEDGFFYDLLKQPDGRIEKFKVRSLVGLIPLFAVERLEARWLEPFKHFRADLEWFFKNRADLIEHSITTVEHYGEKVHVLTLLKPDQLSRILGTVWDKNEFRSDFGLRSLSKHHAQNPFHLDHRHVGYEPAESLTLLKGGNSNWRGPIWFPLNFMLIESLRKLRKGYGGVLTVRQSDGTNQFINLEKMSHGFAESLISIFKRDADGRRPVFGDVEKMQTDPHWKDHILFFEYFNGDTGAGLGASHQTGWTALVASLIDEWR